MLSAFFPAIPGEPTRGLAVVLLWGLPPEPAGSSTGMALYVQGRGVH